MGRQESAASDGLKFKTTDEVAMNDMKAFGNSSARAIWQNNKQMAAAFARRFL
jgi:hypothetical protein